MEATPNSSCLLVTDDQLKEQGKVGVFLLKVVETEPDMSFEDKLIKLVKQHPCLYDKTERGHKESAKCDRAWEQIAKDLGFPGRRDKAKRRWYHVRQSFSKVLKKQKSGDLYPPKWRYYSQLDFLKEHMASKSRNSLRAAQDAEDDDVVNSNYDQVYVKRTLQVLCDNNETLESEDVSYHPPTSERSSSVASDFCEPHSKKTKNTDLPMADPFAEPSNHFIPFVSKLSEQQNERETEAFAQLVAASLAKLSSLRRLRAKRAINAILCDLDEEEILQAT